LFFVLAFYVFQVFLSLRTGLATFATEVIFFLVSRNSLRQARGHVSVQELHTLKRGNRLTSLTPSAVGSPHCRIILRFLSHLRYLCSFFFPFFFNANNVFVCIKIKFKHKSCMSQIILPFAFLFPFSVCISAVCLLGLCQLSPFLCPVVVMILTYLFLVVFD